MVSAVQSWAPARSQQPDTAPVFSSIALPSISVGLEPLSALEVGPRGRAVAAWFVQNPFETIDYQDQIAAATSQVTVGAGTPLAEASLDPRLLLERSGTTTPPTAPTTQFVVPQSTSIISLSPSAATEQITVQAGRVDGVLLPDLMTLEMVAMALRPVPELVNGRIPLGKFIRKVAAETAPNNFALAA